MPQRRPALAVALVAALVAIAAAVAAITIVAPIALTVADFLALVVPIAVAALTLAFKTLATITALVLTQLARGRAVGRSGSRRLCRRGIGSRGILLRLAEIAAAVMAMTLALLTVGRLAIDGGGAVLVLSLMLSLALPLSVMTMAATALMPRPALFGAAARAPDFDQHRLGRRGFGARRLGGSLSSGGSLGNGGFARRFGSGFWRRLCGRLGSCLLDRRFGLGRSFWLRLDDDRRFLAGRERAHLRQQRGRWRGIAGDVLIDHFGDGLGRRLYRGFC